MRATRGEFQIKGKWVKTSTLLKQWERIVKAIPSALYKGVLGQTSRLDIYSAQAKRMFARMGQNMGWLPGTTSRTNPTPAAIPAQPQGQQKGKVCLCFRDGFLNTNDFANKCLFLLKH